MAVGERSAVVAEATRSGSAAHVTLAATFAYPDGVGLDHPEMLGEALGEFLRAKGFTAKAVAVGVPARWVLSKPKEVPPADPHTVAEALRLQVEGEFSSDLDNLAFDYAGETSSSEARTVLLVALQSKHLNRVKAVAEGAKLQLLAVTPVGSVLGAAAGLAAGKPRPAFVVSAGPGGVELAAQDGTSPRALRHLGTTATAPAVLAGELRRAAFAAGGLAAGVTENAPRSLAAVPAAGTNGQGYAANGAGGGGPALVLWDGWGLPADAQQSLADAVGGRLERGDLERFGVGADLGVAPGDVAGAAALAVAAVSPGPFPADFLNPKLAEAVVTGLPRQVVWGAIAAAVVLIVAIWGWRDVSAKQNELDRLKKQLADNAANVKADEAFNAKIELATKLYPGRPRFFAFMADVHSAVPDDGKTFVTTLSLQDSLKGSLGAKTTGETNVPQAIMDALNRSGRFKDVKLTFSKREVAKTGNEITFTVQFAYVPEGTVAAPPATGRSGAPGKAAPPAPRAVATTADARSRQPAAR